MEVTGEKKKEWMKERKKELMNEGNERDYSNKYHPSLPKKEDEKRWLDRNN